MNLVLSQESNNIHLLIEGIKWEQLSSALKHEIVSVERFELIIDINIAYPEDMEGSVERRMELPKQKLPISEIKNQLALYHTVEGYHALDEDRVKASYPGLIENTGLASSEIWKKYLSFVVEHEQPVVVDLGNDNFHLMSVNDLRSPYTYRFTFWRIENLIDFIMGIQNEMTDVEFIKNSISTGTPLSWQVISNPK